VVDRAHPQEVEHLLRVGAGLDEAGQRRAVEVLDELEERLGEVAVRCLAGPAGAEPRLQVCLEVGA
jgi:hypothetical protein